MNLVLFDIDGTILKTTGVSRPALEAAMAEVLDRPISTQGISFAGQTDLQILHDTFVRAALPPDLALFQAIAHRFEEILTATLQQTHITIFPGVVSLIETLHKQLDVQLALLTGNLIGTAYLKLNLVDLGRYFPFGAFGNDHADRNALPAIALARAEAHVGHAFAPEQTVIIGDTPRDIACARAIGAQVIAVCTGHFTPDTLAPYAPDLLLPDLKNPAPILDFLQTSP